MMLFKKLQKTPHRKPLATLEGITSGYRGWSDKYHKEGLWVCVDFTNVKDRFGIELNINEARNLASMLKEAITNAEKLAAQSKKS